MINVKSVLSFIFGESISKAYPSVEDVPIVVQAAQSQKFGDYQCNSAMALSKVCLSIFYILPSLVFCFSNGCDIVEVSL